MAKMAEEYKKISLTKFVFSILYVLLYPILILLLSGDWLWLEGLLFGIWFVSFSVITLLFLYLRDPYLLAERFKMPGARGEKKWDKYFMFVLMPAFFVWITIMPLDAKRYGWTASFPVGLKVLGGIFLLSSAVLLFLAMAENTFASALVRIQTERKQRVIDTGVYSIIRHPMYLGGTLMFVGAPMMLSSLYGIIAGLALSLLFVGRIFGEEKMLDEELEGYKAYKNKVRYRLIPFVW